MWTFIVHFIITKVPFPTKAPILSNNASLFLHNSYLIHQTGMIRIANHITSKNTVQESDLSGCLFLLRN